MYYPSLEDVKKLADQGNLVPVYRELNADLETPVTAYLKVARKPYSFLLESVEGGERLARYSFIGTEPSWVLKTGAGQKAGEVDPLTLLQNKLANYKVVQVPGLPRFHGGAVGYLGYDAVRYFEPRVPKPQNDTLGLPESVFMLTDNMIIFDHVQHKIKVVSHMPLKGDDAVVEKTYARAVAHIERLVRRLERPLKSSWLRAYSHDGQTAPAPKFTSNFTREDYHLAVLRAQEYIKAGDVIQVVLSQRLAVPTQAEPLDLYRALRAINPSPYMYYLALDDFAVVGASPELLIRVEDGVLENHPIAGTRRRGYSPEEDETLEKELVTNEKERAEHIMLVDLGRNDIGRVSKPGTVKVTQLMDVEKYSHVMHLVSHVTGELRTDYSVYDALRASFPAGTVSGAPKIRAMEIIAELEGLARGAYAGAVGYFSFAGNMDTAICIRTMVVKDGAAYIQAGGGIVYDSDPEAEYQETLAKAQAALRAIAQANAALEVKQ
ncbi:MAG: anthranilate synthase component I [Dehalococcoidia bacterium]|nr:anthranilate synthase component I [Dehalococcoidia bacterium]